MDNHKMGVLSIVSALLLGSAGTSFGEKFDHIVGAVAPEGGAYLIKHFPVPEGTTITGVQFYSNEGQTTFPEVLVLKGPARALSDGKVIAEFSDVKAVAERNLVNISFVPVLIASGADLYVAVRLPVCDGISDSMVGDGVGAWDIREGPTSSYFASGTGGLFGLMDVELAIDLVYHSNKTLATNGSDHGRISESLPSKLEVSVLGLSGDLVSGSVFALALPRSGHISLTVYDAAGRRIDEVANGFYAAGWHRVGWDGKGRSGHRIASGVYLYRVDFDDEVLTGKIIVLR